MKIAQILAAWVVSVWLASAQEGGNQCSRITVTRVSQEIPCATVGTLIIDSDLSGALKLDNLTEVTDFFMVNNEGLVSLSSTSLSKIEGDFLVNGTADLREILLPNLTNITEEFSVRNAPKLDSITLGGEPLATVWSIFILNTSVSDLFFNLDTIRFLSLGFNANLNEFASQVREIGDGIFVANGDNFLVYLPNLVWAISLLIDSATALQLWSLQHVNSTFEITNNDLRPVTGAPDPLNLPNLETIGSYLFMANNTGLVKGNFPLLKTVGGTVSIMNNSAVKELNFPQLDNIGGNLTVADNFAIDEIDGFPQLTEVSGSVFLRGDFVYARMPELSDAAGGFGLNSSENINDSCAALEETFQRERQHQTFICRSAGVNWASGGDNTTESDPADTDPGQTQDEGQESSAKSLSGGAIAGIVISALAAIGIFAAVLFIIWRRRRNGAAVGERTSTTEAGDNRESKYTSVPPDELQGVPRSELASPDPELEGSTAPKDGGTIYYEVDGTPRRGT